MKFFSFLILSLALFSCSKNEESTDLMPILNQTVEPDYYVTGKFGSNGGDFEFKYFENQNTIYAQNNSYVTNSGNDTSNNWYESTLRNSLTDNNNSIQFIFKDHFITSLGPSYDFEDLFTTSNLTYLPYADQTNWDIGGFRINYYDENGALYSTIYGDNSDFDYNIQSITHLEDNGRKYALVKGLLSCKIYKSSNHSEFKNIYAVRFKLRFNKEN